MGDLNLVQHATYSPTWCMACKSDTGPFIDTRIEEVTINTAHGAEIFTGHVYICSSCVTQMAHLIGCIVPEEARKLHDERGELLFRVQILEDELADARDNKVVSREDFKVWLGETVKADAELKAKPGRPRKSAE